MSDIYPIVDVSTWQVIHPEHRGTKEKYWLVAPDNEAWLFKHRKRPTIGDDWGEKISGEIAEVLGIPHPVVELAQIDGAPGVISRDFTRGRDLGELILGNQLLVMLDEAYPNSSSFRLPAHTIERVMRALGGSWMRPPSALQPFDGVEAAADVFIGYLMLDAVVGNQDRHHQNWGALYDANAEQNLGMELAPSFDHASSLAFNLDDDHRLRRLTTTDPQFTVEAFVRKAESKFFRAESDKRGLHQIEAFRAASEVSPAAGQAWLGRLMAVGLDQILAQIDRAPVESMTDVSRRFARKLVECNFKSVQKLRR